MIRKTFICVVGLLAGASTGAYVDGFFDQENLVTNAYHQIASQFDPSAGNADLPGDISSASSSFNSESTGVTAKPATRAEDTIYSKTSGMSSKTPAAKTESDKEVSGDSGSGSTKLSNSDQPSPDATEEAQTVLETSFADSVNLTEKMVSPSAKGDEIANGDDPKEMSREKAKKDLAEKAKKKNKGKKPNRENKTAKAEEKKTDKQSLKAAKELALLEVRFSAETFKGTSGGELKYRKLSPRIAGAGQPLPLIIFLHGSGERGDDNLSQLKNGLSFLASRKGMQEFPATIIAPQCPKNQRWTKMLVEGSESERLDPIPSDVMRLTMDLIDTIQLTDNIDPNRIYVTGLSMGGFGTFDLIARRHELFAAAVPLCGGGDTSLSVIDRIKNIPMWIIHGEDDSVVPVKNSREMVKALKDVGASPRYSELAGFKHNVWDAAYADLELYKWMFNQSKQGPLNKAKTPDGQVASRSEATSDAKSNTNSNANSNLNPNSTSNADGDKPKQRSTANAGRQNFTDAASLQASLQGEWKVLAATQRGRRANAATLANMRVAFNDDSLIIKLGDRNEVAKFKLPTSQNSSYPWIDMVSQREGVLDSAGILAKQGDKLVICWAVPGQPRPTTFNSKEGVKTLVLEQKK